jgi:hypothetical protein
MNMIEARVAHLDLLKMACRPKSFIQQVAKLLSEQGIQFDTNTPLDPGNAPIKPLYEWWRDKATGDMIVRQRVIET